MKNYWLLIETGQTFSDRKEAKDVLGHKKFNALCKSKKIIYINNKSCAYYGKLHTNTYGI